MITCTVFRNIVMESNIVTPAIAIFITEIRILSRKNKIFSLKLILKTFFWENIL